jgi:hypothetical protein
MNGKERQLTRSKIHRTYFAALGRRLNIDLTVREDSIAGARRASDELTGVPDIVGIFQNTVKRGLSAEGLARIRPLQYPGPVRSHLFSSFIFFPVFPHELVGTWA